MIKHGKSGIETEKIRLINCYTKLSTFSAFNSVLCIYAVFARFVRNFPQLGYTNFSHGSNEVIRMLKRT